jgi:hypothetical protein
LFPCFCNALRFGAFERVEEFGSALKRVLFEKQQWGQDAEEKHPALRGGASDHLRYLRRRQILQCVSQLYEVARPQSIFKLNL